VNQCGAKSASNIAGAVTTASGAMTLTMMMGIALVDDE
jgi:hypothetical protein